MSSDVGAERAVLAGLCKYGGDLYLDVCDMVKVDTFTVTSNQMIFKCIDKLCKADDNAQIDLPSILSAAKELALDHHLSKPEETRHLKSILALHVERTNVRRFAAKIRNLQIARLIGDQAKVVQEKMATMDGTEKVSSMIAQAEEIIFDFTSLLDDSESNPKKMGDSLREYIQHLADNPVKQMGIPTGMAEWDRQIGGGLRDATLNVIGARPKMGKTVITDNIGFYIAENSKIPVLNLDTEMTYEDHVHRSLAMISGVDINSIETGQFGANQDKRAKVGEALDRLEKVPYFHKSIAGMPFEDQLALMRRWLQKEVGLQLDGKAKKCVIIYDYLKLMDANSISDAMREFQALGFMMTNLHNFAVRYKIPFIVLIQLNRDGIDGEGTGAASGSDRIIWLCSNFTIFKPTSDEEIAQYGPQTGNRKMVVVAARHGEGLTDPTDFINCNFHGWCARIKESGLASKLNGAEENQDLQNIVNDANARIPFG